MTIHIGLILALTIILHSIRLYHMPQGGSVTLGGMISLILLSLYYSPSVGYLAGFIYGFINFIQDPFILHPLQVIFDYPLPYMLLSIVGYFKRTILLGASVAIIARFLCHFFSGIIFFADYVPVGTSIYTYSLIFNITYLLPELIITKCERKAPKFIYGDIIL
ncbi:energy-coupled thiamine transporter ThiT, partial [Megamonas funiformis]|uniref:energy-coupled thiamine transporter ThiT n=1 Tax=Megamonas funiformis TaxID=437897 RepID=UPI00265F7335